MSNFTVQTPKGIDIPIQTLQTRLYSDLNWSNSDFYGRLFKYKKENGYFPVWYASGGEYKDVLVSDTKNAVLFFLADDESTSKEGLIFKTKVKIVVMANLQKIVSDNTSGRADTETQQQVLKSIRKSKNMVIDSGIETGIENILKGYDISSLNLADLQPFHCFSINGTITYHFN